MLFLHHKSEADHAKMYIYICEVMVTWCFDIVMNKAGTSFVMKMFTDRYWSGWRFHGAKNQGLIVEIKEICEPV